MDALGIERGDVAGQLFSGDYRKKWRDADQGSRSGMLSAWLRAECLDAAYTNTIEETAPRVS